MADPLSITASIVGIVQLATSVFSGLSRFAKQAKDAKSQVSELARETRNLSGILHNLSLLSSSMDKSNSDPWDSDEQHSTGFVIADDDGSLALSNYQAHALHACRETLLKLKTRLAKARVDFESGRKRDALVRSVKWPFSTSETTQLLQEMERHKTNITMALSTDTIEKLLETLSKQTLIESEIKEVRKTLAQRFAQQDRLQHEGQRREVVNFYAKTDKVNPRSNLQASLNQRQPMTGLWLLEGSKFLEWVAMDNGKLWLTGIPGSGKTVLCGAVIERMAQESDDMTALAFFFCDYKNTASQVLNTVLGSLAAQIALQNDKAFDVLQQAYDNDRLSSGFQKPIEAAGFIQVIIEMSAFFNKITLVIDALDECGDEATVAALSSNLQILAKECPVISMALFSRLEEPIRDFLAEDFDTIQISAHTEDLELFVGAQMATMKSLKDLPVKNPDLNEDIHQTLVHKASGMFRWVVCQLDWLSRLPTNKARRKALNTLPPTLNETYQRILERVSFQSTHANIETIVQNALWWIGTADPPLNITELCEAVSITEDDSIDPDDLVDESVLLRGCGSLIRKGRFRNTDIFEFAHFSVQEYLEGISTTSPLSRFRLSKDRSWFSLSQTSLRMLLFPQFHRDVAANVSEVAHAEKRDKQHPFYKYAANNWVRYLPASTGATDLQKLTRSLFDASKSGNFLAWLLTYIHNESDGEFEGEGFEQELIACLLRHDFTTLHVTALLGQSSLCQWLLDEGADVNMRNSFGAPLHFALAGPEIFFHLRSDRPHIYKNMLVSGPSVNIGDTVNILLKEGADTTLSWKQFSAAHLALQYCFKSGTAAAFLPFLSHCVHFREDAVQGFQKIDYYLSNPAIVEVSQAILCAAERSSSWSATPSEAARMVSIAQVHLLADIPQKALGTEPEIARTIMDEDFVLALELAIEHDKEKLVSQLVADARFDDTREKELPGGSLAHCAAISYAYKVMEWLINSGVNVALQDSAGRTPLHFCSLEIQLPLLKILLEAGVSPTTIDANGETIWHAAARSNSVGTIETLARHDSFHSSTLQIVSNAGRTPLAEAFYHRNERAATGIFRYCSTEPGYFTSKVPVIQLATTLGSKAMFCAVVEYLTRAGEDTSIPDGSSPLHHVSLDSTPTEFVQYLISIYDIRVGRKDGTLPIELVLGQIGRINHRNRSTHRAEAILRNLLDENLVREASSKGRDIWKLWCSVLLEIVEPLSWFRKSLASQVTSILADNSALEVYERAFGESAIIPLLGQNKSGMNYSEAAGLALVIAIAKTGAFEQASKHPSCRELARKYLELSNRTNELHPVLAAFLERGLDIHAGKESAEQSILELACRLDPTFSIYKAVLDNADIERLNDSFSNGDNPIQTLIYNNKRENEPNVRYLLSKGVDPNKSDPNSDALPPIVLAACCGKFNLVELIIEQGGSIDVQSKTGMDVFTAACCWGRVDVMQKVGIESKSDYRWGICRAFPTVIPSYQRVEGSLDDRLNALHLASFFGHPKAIEYLLDNLAGSAQGSSKRIRNDLVSEGTFQASSTTCDPIAMINRGTPKYKNTALHFASINGHSKTIQLLLARGADVNATNTYGTLPVGLAIKNGQMASAKVLLANGAKLGSQIGWAEEQMTYLSEIQDLEMTSYTRTQIRIALESAILRADIDQCSKLLENDNTGLVQAPMLSCGICTPILRAIPRLNVPGLLELLVKNGATSDRVTCPKNHVPIDLNALHLTRHDDHVKLFLDMDINCGSSWLEDCLNPIHVAAALGNVNRLRIIADHIRSHANQYRHWILQTSLWKTPAHGHQWLSEAELLKIIFDIPTGLVPVHAYIPKKLRGFEEVSALTVASWFGHREVIGWIISLGVDLDKADPWGQTALHFAIRAKHGDIAKLLIQKGADVNLPDYSGVTVLHAAMKNNNLPGVLLLQEADADFSALDCNGNGVLEQAIKSENTKLFDIALAHGADPHRKNDAGVSPMFYAASSKTFFSYLANSSVLSTVLDSNINIVTEAIELDEIDVLARLLRWLRPEDRAHLLAFRAKSDLCRTPLSYAASIGNSQVVELLLKAGADIELMGPEEGTPAMTACNYGRLDVLRTLVRAGARVRYDTNDGRCHSVMLAGRRHPAIIRWFLVERFTEQPRLEYNIEQDLENGRAQAAVAWTGIKRDVGYVLRGSNRRRWQESSLDFAKRLSQLRGKLLGKVVSIMVEE
ncbi:ankyrin [Thozetella sp. PMI_491]|nr:ankyrin [Thozetella sp. PMI_491]